MGTVPIGLSLGSLFIMAVVAFFAGRLYERASLGVRKLSRTQMAQAVGFRSGQFAEPTRRSRFFAGNMRGDR